MAKITGLEEIMNNLAKATKRIEGATEAGVIKGAMFIRRQSQKLTPVRLGNLRNSAYVIGTGLMSPPGGGGGGFKGKDAGKMSADLEEAKMVAKGQARALARRGPVAAVGYGAVYALSVHENPKAGGAGGTAAADTMRTGIKVPLSQIHSKRGQWKFLEQPLKENEGRILDIIKREVRF